MPPVSRSSEVEVPSKKLWYKTFCRGVVEFEGDFEGDFNDKTLSGKGKETWMDGTVYEGTFKNNLLEGKGKSTYSDGSSVEGIFSEGLLHGQGEKDQIHYGRNQRMYEKGEFKNGRLVKGIREFQDKETKEVKKILEREFASDYLHGKGKRILPNGEIWEGDFVAGELHGRGKITDASGEILYDGQFKFGQYQEPPKVFKIEI